VSATVCPSALKWSCNPLARHLSSAVEQRSGTCCEEAGLRQCSAHPGLRADLEALDAWPAPHRSAAPWQVLCNKVYALLALLRHTRISS